MQRIILVVATFPFASLCFAQLQTSQWYFGGNAGLDFTTSPPTVISNTNINTSGGTSSIADSAGNLLFYTDGATVWNSQHQVMANGTGLAATPGKPQNVVIAPSVTNTSRYYIYTCADFSMTTVDMSLAAGLGSVVAKNQHLLHGCIPAVIAGADWNSSQANTRWMGSHFIVLKGEDLVPLSPEYMSWGSTYVAPGSYVDKWLKISPDARIYALVAQKPKLGSGHFTIELWNFFFRVVASGQNLLKPFSVVTSDTLLGDLFACEFSPDGTKLYASSPGTHRLYQFDLCAGSDSLIRASLYTMSTGTVSIHGMQLAPDGKIYCASNPSLSVINNPDLAGAACGFSLQQQSIGTASCGLTLPNQCGGFVQYTLAPLSLTFAVTPSVSCGSVTFTPVASSRSNCPASREAILSAQWDFGDPATGASNTSTLLNPVHQFSAPGTYSVRLAVWRGNRKDSVIQSVVVPGPWPSTSVAGVFTICANNSASITASGAHSYTWSGGQTGSVLVVSPTVSTTYTVVGANSNGCSQQTTFSVEVWPCTSIREHTPDTEMRLRVLPDEDQIELLLVGADEPLHTGRTVQIIDLSGRAVLSASPEWHNGVALLDIRTLPDGVYCLVLREPAGVSPVRFLLTR